MTSQRLTDEGAGSTFYDNRDLVALSKVDMGPGSPGSGLLDPYQPLGLGHAVAVARQAAELEIGVERQRMARSTARKLLRFLTSRRVPNATRKPAGVRS